MQTNRYMLRYEDGQKLLLAHPALQYFSWDDAYLSDGVLVRHIIGNGYDYHQLIDRDNTGNVDSHVFNALKKQSKLCIRRNRNLIEKDNFSSTYIDLFDAPMKVASIEVVATNGSVVVGDDYVERLFGMEMKSCGKSLFDYFRRKIGICGAESSGKSESAKLMSHILNTEFRANSFHVTEFATSFIQKYGRRPNFVDHFFIWHGQKERESSASKADIIISDCPTFLSYLYMLQMEKASVENSEMYLAKIYKRVLADISSYADMVFLRLQDYRENNIRFHGTIEAQQMDKRIEQFLDDHNTNHVQTTYHNVREELFRLLSINNIFPLNSVSP